MNENWILTVGTQKLGFTTFPYAFRQAYNMLRKETEAGKPTAALINDLTIIGPPNLKGERTKYSYRAATEMAKGNGLLTADGQLNSKEFKKKF